MKTKYFKRLTILCMIVSLLCMPSALAQSATGAIASGADAPDYSLNLELTVTDGVVTGITLYDAAGATLYENADLTDSTPEDALSAALAQIDENGYLASSEEDGYLLITTNGGILDADEASSLRSIAKDYLSSLGKDYEVDSASLGADVSAKADTLGLPGGRYLMMEYIAEQEGISIEEAIALYSGESVQTLMRSFDGMREAMNENGNSYGEKEQNQEQVREQEQEKTQEQLEEEAQQREEDKEQRQEDKGSGKGNASSNSNSSSGNGSSSSSSGNGSSNSSSGGNKSNGKK